MIWVRYTRTHLKEITIHTSSTNISFVVAGLTSCLTRPTFEITIHSISQITKSTLKNIFYQPTSGAVFYVARFTITIGISIVTIITNITTMSRAKRTIISTSNTRWVYIQIKIYFTPQTLYFECTIWNAIYAAWYYTTTFCTYYLILTLCLVKWLGYKYYHTCLFKQSVQF